IPEIAIYFSTFSLVVTYFKSRLSAGSIFYSIILMCSVVFTAVRRQGNGSGLSLPNYFHKGTGYGPAEKRRRRISI
ncbi:MAG: hypothetical protein AAF666_18430, partial [Pseudomonadota bacterium]